MAAASHRSLRVLSPRVRCSSGPTQKLSARSRAGPRSGLATGGNRNPSRDVNNRGNNTHGMRSAEGLETPQAAGRGSKEEEGAAAAAIGLVGAKRLIENPFSAAVVAGVGGLRFDGSCAGGEGSSACSMISSPLGDRVD